ncbi:replication initiation protein [Geomonas subterranea]|uniref:replication initiation protein n=1 Tax=Geomonas subterranea TaxID=2847989 RepID=UPI001CD25FB1|nr:replication initiation protein [Geomonas fuzhouensis]
MPQRTQRNDQLLPWITPETEYRKSHLVSLMQYSLSLAEAKAVTGLMYLASLQYEENPNRIVFSSNLKEVSKVTGVTYHYESLRAVLAGLRGKEVTLNYVGKHAEYRERSMNIIAETDIAKQDGMDFTYQFPETIRQQLLEPDYFTLIRLMTVLELSSKYSYAIYEYCKSYIGVGVTEIRTIEGWRGFLCLGNEYPVFAELERNVFKKAKDEINGNPNIEIEIDYKKIRDGKKIGALQFMVKLKARQLSAGTPDGAEQGKIAESLLGLLPEKVQTDKNRELLARYLEHTTAHYCVANIQYTYEHCKQDKAFSSYLAKALQDDWGHELRKRRETDEQFRSMKGGHPRISDLDPVADQVYGQAFDMATETRRQEIRLEMDRKVLSGTIRKNLPLATKIRQTMQYMEVWL